MPVQGADGRRHRGGEPQESLEAPLEVLAEKVDGLSEGALQILAGITSAPTTDDFKGAIKGMTIELLMKLRKRFRGMGF